MNHRSVALTFILALAGTALSAQSCPDATTLTRGIEQPLATVRYLADDALGGRLAGTPEERCAGDYIAEQFRRIGLRPGGSDGTYFQTMPLASAINPHAPAGSGRNVIGVLEGSDPGLKQQSVIIGAHYDHLGMGGFGSLAPDSRAVHNGADDNASGVAALIEAARILSMGKRPASTVVFVAFTGEEEGVLGSAYHASHPVLPLTSARAMLNMDMVGRLGTGNLIVYGTGTASEWKDILPEAARKQGISGVTWRPEGYGPSDHTSFYAKDVPVLHFFTNVHADYHRPTDDWEKIDGPGLQRVGALVADVANQIADRRSPLTLVRGAGTPPGEAQSGDSGYGAYLGSIPDFTPVEFGVKLSGVREGSPADKAGIRGGDTIVGFNDEPVKDLYVLTAQLRKHKPGESVHVKVLRDGKEVITTVVLGTRS
jgi:hypothetical protein